MKKSFLLTTIIATIIGLSSCNNNKSPVIETYEPIPSLNIRLKIFIDQDFENESGNFLSVDSIIRYLFSYAGFEVIDTNNSNYNLTLKIKIHGNALSERYSNDPANPFGGKNYYVGADIDGTFNFLDSLGIKFGNSTFSGGKECPKTVSEYSNEDPSKAPFQEAFYNSNFFGELGKVITLRYGNNVTIFYWCASFNVLRFQDNGCIIDGIQAIQAMGDLRDARIIKRLLTKETLVCLFDISLIADALSKIGIPAVDPLINILESDPDYDNCRKSIAACTLGKIKDKQALNSLNKALKSDSPLVRFWSCFALFNIGDSKKADKTLKKFTNENLGNDSKKWAEWWKKNSSRYN